MVSAHGIGFVTKSNGDSIIFFSLPPIDFNNHKTENTLFMSKYTKDVQKVMLPIYFHENYDRYGDHNNIIG